MSGDSRSLKEAAESQKAAIFAGIVEIIASSKTPEAALQRMYETTMNHDRDGKVVPTYKLFPVPQSIFPHRLFLSPIQCMLSNRERDGARKPPTSNNVFKYRLDIVDVLLEIDYGSMDSHALSRLGKIMGKVWSDHGDKLTADEKRRLMDKIQLVNERMSEVYVAEQRDQTPPRPSSSSSTSSPS